MLQNKLFFTINKHFRTVFFSISFNCISNDPPSKEGETGISDSIQLTCDENTALDIKLKTYHPKFNQN